MFSSTSGGTKPLRLQTFGQRNKLNSGKMSRKFSDSEIRAYSKNRYEDKLLRQRLEKLKESVSIFHDATARQRQDLVAECKDIKMTSGESRAPAGFVMDTEFDISKRVTRPWAYSVMETTYNAVYRDAVIPLPKQSKHKIRSRSGISRGFASRSSIYSNRAMSSKSYSPSMKSSMTIKSDNTLQKLAPPTINRSVSNPEIVREGHRGNSDIEIKIDGSYANDTRCQETDKVIEDAVTKQSLKSNSVIPVEDTKDQIESASKHAAENPESSGHIESEILTEDIYAGDTHGFTNNVFDVKARKIDTRIITLPPVYKIDSKAYQDAERDRAISRSRSRVSFSNLHESHEDRAPKPKSPTETKKATSDTKSPEHNNEFHHRLEVKEKTEELSEENTSQKKLMTVHTIDPDTLLDVQVRKQDDIFYRGRRLKNYIKPEERYKLDPLVMKRRQNKMDKLAKESSTFLKRVNHENIKVEIAFPRSARKRILTKLVQENNSDRSKTVKDSNEPVIQRKIQYFMNSISEYIHQQQLEREQYFS